MLRLLVACTRSDVPGKPGTGNDKATTIIAFTFIGCFCECLSSIMPQYNHLWNSKHQAFKQAPKTFLSILKVGCPHKNLLITLCIDYDDTVLKNPWSRYSFTGIQMSDVSFRQFAWVGGKPLLFRCATSWCGGLWVSLHFLGFFIHILQIPRCGRPVLQSRSCLPTAVGCYTARKNVQAISGYSGLDEEGLLMYVHSIIVFPQLTYFSQTVFFHSSLYITVTSVRWELFPVAPTLGFLPKVPSNGHTGILPIHGLHTFKSSSMHACSLMLECRFTPIWLNLKCHPMLGIYTHFTGLNWHSKNAIFGYACVLVSRFFSCSSKCSRGIFC